MVMLQNFQPAANHIRQQLYAARAPANAQIGDVRLALPGRWPMRQWAHSGMLTLQYEEDVVTTSWRHTNTAGIDGPHLDALRKLDLVVRTVSTIRNYDYLFEIR